MPLAVPQAKGVSERRSASFFGLFLLRVYCLLCDVCCCYDSRQQILEYLIFCVLWSFSQVDLQPNRSPPFSLGIRPVLRPPRMTFSLHISSLAFETLLPLACTTSTTAAAVVAPIDGVGRMFLAFLPSSKPHALSRTSHRLSAVALAPRKQGVHHSTYVSCSNSSSFISWRGGAA